MDHPIRVTALVENTAQGLGILAEHGLSYWIQWGSQRILLDTGQGGVLTHNALKMGLDLGQVDAVVLSHGHYDHTGGLAAVLDSAQAPAIYAHPAALEAKYSRNKDGTSRRISMPGPILDSLRRLGTGLISVESPTEVADGLRATGPVPRTTDFEDTGGSFYLDADCARPDPLLDDQSMFFQTPEGIVVLLGCAHSGVVNTLRYISELRGGQPIHTVIGGMHLIHASPRRITRTIEEFRRLDVQRIAPCHCTGMAAQAAMWHAFPGRCSICNVGTTFEFAGPA